MLTALLSAHKPHENHPYNYSMCTCSTYALVIISMIIQIRCIIIRHRRGFAFIFENNTSKPYNYNHEMVGQITIMSIKRKAESFPETRSRDCARDRSRAAQWLCGRIQVKCGYCLRLLGQSHGLFCVTSCGMNLWGCSTQWLSSLAN